MSLTSFTYPNTPYFLPTGTSIDISAAFVGTPPASTVFKITPGLPTGLSIDASNGSIIGATTFSSITNATLYTVDASYSTGVVTSSLTISVDFSPVFSYPFTPYYKEINISTSIVPIYLISNLQSIIYTLTSSPLLSAVGLNLNINDGLISGTPNVSSNLTTYTIRANNNGVIYDATLQISIQLLPTVSYAQSLYIITQNTVVSISPSPIDNQYTYAIDGCALPLGLFFDPLTGAIYGTPTLPTTFRTYTITVTNLIGSTSTTLTLSIIKEVLAPPAFSSAFDDGLCLTDPQIAMRRKAEILKYKKNSTGLTSNQNWSLVVQGKGPYAKRVWANQNTLGSNPNISGLDQQGNVIICNSNPVVCAPTSSSDVPGPIMNLCLNPAIPLVGYVQPIRTKTNIGFKWPQRAWRIGDMGFPVGNAGRQ